MSEARPKPDPEALLAHRDFVRSVAMKLVFDEHAADDIVQETWLAALKNAPAQPRSLRAWLARVARNLALKSARTDIRRRQRERREARPDETPSTLDALERIALERRVIDAIVSLDEPYRTTLILRYYEDLPPREIAKRMDANGATVRTRLKRGLAMLRARFDREAGSSRAWMLALLPLLVPTVPAAGAATTSGGILFMSAKKTLAATVAIAAALLGILTWTSSQSEHSESRRRAELAVTHGATAPADAAPAPDPRTTATTVPSAPVVVRVIDEAGAPVAGAKVERFAEHHVEYGISFAPDWFAPARERVADQQATTDATGRARFDFPLRSTARFVATKTGLARGGSGPLTVRSATHTREVEIVLARAHTLRGRVVGADGAPMPGITLLAGEARSRWNQIYTTRPARTVSNDDGAFRFDNLPPRDVALFVVRPGAAPVHIRNVDFPAIADFEIVLRAGGVVRGRVTDAEAGAPIAGARVTATGSVPHFAAATTDTNGEYVIASLPPTSLLSVKVERDGYYEMRGGKPRQVRLEAGDACRRDVRMKRAPRLHGTVRGPRGAVAGLTIQAVEQRKSGMGAMVPCRTADDGSYSLALRPGRHKLQIGTLDFAFADAAASLVELAGDGDLEHAIVLIDNTMWIGTCELVGSVIDADGRGVEGALVRMPTHSARSGADGRFRMKGLPAGTHRVFADGPGLRAATPAKVTLAADAAVTDFVVTVNRIPAIAGTVRGAELQNAYVLVAVMNPSQTGGGSMAQSNAWARLWYGARRVLVGADGSYRVGGIAPHGRVFVRAGALNAALSKPIEVKGAGPYDFALDPGEPISGRVVDRENGKPIAGAQIELKSLEEYDPSPLKEWFNERDQTVVGVTDAGGRFEIRHCRGEYLLRAIAADAQQPAPLRVRAGTRGLEVALDRVHEMRGTVLFASGGPAPGLRVLAHTIDGQIRRWSVGTSARGAFVIRNLRAGEYRLTVGGETARTRTVGPFPVGRADIAIRVERAGPGEGEGWPTPQAGNFEISGTVRDTNGQGLVGFRIWAAVADTNERTLGRRTATTVAGGKFTIRGLAAGAYRVSAAAPRTNMMLKKNGVGAGTRDLAFVFDSIAGVLVDEGGTPLAGRRIRALRAVNTTQTRDVVTDAKGAFVIDGLVPGDYALGLRRTSHERGRLLVPGTARTGVYDLRLTASLGARISGTVVDEDGDAIHQAWVAVDEAGRSNSARSDSDGRFEITGLVDGRKYRVRAKAHDRIELSLDGIDAGARGLRLTMRTGLTCTGRLVDPKGTPIRNPSIRCATSSASDASAPVIWTYGKTDESGSFRISGLRAGKHKAEAFRPTKSGLQWMPCGKLTAGEQGVDLRIDSATVRDR